MFPPCNAISEGRLPLCSTSSDAGALPSEVRIENDSDRIFFFQKFSGNHFYPRFMVRCSLLAENIFSVFRSLHSAPTHRYTSLDSRLLLCNAISEGRLPLCNTSSEAGALPSDKKYMIDLLEHHSKHEIHVSHFSVLITQMSMRQCFLSPYESRRVFIHTKIVKLHDRNQRNAVQLLIVYSLFTVSLSVTILI